MGGAVTPGELALRFTEAHDEWQRLQRHRSSFLCKYEVPRHDEPAEAGGSITFDITPSDPCWKWHHGSGTTDEFGRQYWETEPGYNREEADWCPSCVERAKVNKAVKVAGARRNALFGALLRASRGRL